jgi:integrase
VQVGKKKKRVPKGTPGAFPKTEKSDHWYVFYQDGSGKERRKKLSWNKEIAHTEMGEFLKDMEKRRVGLVNDHIDQAARPLSEHLDDFEESLKLRPITARRQKEFMERIRKLVAAAGWTRLADITVDSVNSTLLKMKKKHGGTVGAETRNHYRQHIKQFINWCIPDRLPYSPLTKLKKENVKVDRRHDRRAPTVQEQNMLINTTKVSTHIYAVGRATEMDGPTRAMLYDLAPATGLRREEIRTLTRESFDLKKGLLTVRAAYSKHRETDVIPLAPWMVERLKSYFENGGKLWNNLTKHTSAMLKLDLKAAGIPYVAEGPDGPLYFDFHSFRHAFVSAVCQAQGPGVVNKDQMEFTRHKTAHLFLKVYAKTNSENVRRIANQLRDPLKKPSDEQASAG